MSSNVETPSRNYRFPAILGGLSFFLFFYGLGSIGLLGPDEPRYAQVAREMYDRGEWVTPTLLGRTWFEKPVLLYWLLRAGYATLGVTEWGARIVPACLAVLGIGWMYRFAGRIRDREFGFAAAAILASSVFYFAFSRVATFDLLLTVTLFPGLIAAYEAIAAIDPRTGRLTAITSVRRFNILLLQFYGCVGVSLIAKGLIGGVLAGGIVGLFILLDRKQHAPRTVLRLRPFLGAAVTAAVAALWYLPAIYQHGWTFIQEFIIAHHFQRYTSDRFHHAGPVYFYVPVLLGGVFPWTVFFLGGWWTTTKSLFAGDSLRRFAWCWIAVPLVFFSFSGSKLPGYLLPVWPAAALMAAEGVRLAGRRSRLVTGGLFLVVGIGVVAMSGRLPVSPGWIPAAFLIAGSAILVLRRLGTVQMIAWAMALIVPVAVTQVFTGLEERESFKHLSLVARSGRPGEMLASYQCRKYAPAFYVPERFLCCDADNEPVRFESPEEVAAQLRTSGLLLIAPTRSVESLRRFRIEVLATQDRFQLIRVSL